MKVRSAGGFVGVVALLSLSRSAAAEVPDAFGVGNGHSGAYAAAAADEVVNAYAPLTAGAGAGSTTLQIGTVIGDPVGFAAGDVVMIWRPGGLPVADAPAGNQSRVVLADKASGVVGRYEFARIAPGGVNGSTLTLTKGLGAAFADDVTQVIKVPEHTTVDVPAGTSIVAAPWQSVGSGFAGGIVVLLANGAVTLEGSIHANARGFRGGKLDENLNEVALSCPNASGVEAQGYAAKGEGIVSSEFGGVTHGGRGNHANGAGGGNCVENGGAGGGHAGQGGAGGNAILANARGGLGGAGLDYALLQRLTMGGGGGAGEQKNGVGSAGGAGGGVVFVRARSLNGAGSVTANGETAANAGILGLESDGAGGGGAGGSLVLRIVDTITCSTAATRGGTGGSTAVIGVNTWGAGGGGAGGRALIQAKTNGGCPIDTTAGAAGGGRGAAAGGGGETQPPPPGAFCFSNTAPDLQCADPTPVCDVGLGECKKCTGPFGQAPPSQYPCVVAGEPVCSTDGSCNPCNGDNGSGATNACQLIGAPHCFLGGTPRAGECGKCTVDADCTGHAGPKCNVTAGICGQACTDDSQCAANQWCAQNVCIPKTPNSEPVPNIPPIDGECTVEKGARVCLSAVCEEVDDKCGLLNERPCAGKPERCRSSICFPADSLCGLPSGEPCTANGQCRSALCKDGKCFGCDSNTDCPIGTICDLTKKECVPGPADGGADGGPGSSGGTSGSNAEPFGVVAGGGCACRTTLPSGTSPIALGTAAIAAIALLARRRKKGEG